MEKKYRILLVDDAIEWINSHKNILKSLFGEKFFCVDFVTSAKEGFNKILQEKNYDLIIVDLEMERITGEKYAGAWLIKNLQKRNDLNSKYIIISGSYDI